jgi:hypothetical protein
MPNTISVSSDPIACRRPPIFTHSGPAEWRLFDHIQHDSRANPELAEIAQCLPIPVPDSLHAERLTERCLGQRSGPAFHMPTA